MAEVLFNHVVLVSFLLYFQIECFYFLCYNNVIFFNKLLKVSKTTTVTSVLSSGLTHSPYFVFLLIALFFFKNSNGSVLTLLLVFTTYLLKVNQALERITNYTNANNIIHLILPTFSIFFFLFFFITSFLTLFFFIELYGVLYYFCFLTSYTFTNQTVLKYKNGLLLLL